MLIQQRARVLRLIRQHDHALLSGSLAFAWRSERESPLAPSILTALGDRAAVRNNEVS